MNEHAFPPEVVEELDYYVYRLIDPRNGVTFYVGKGKGNRVFAHCQAAIDCGDDEASQKIRQIREITAAGFEVVHVIHRHGMPEKIAMEVEAALIDAYPGLSNLAGGYHNSERGVMHAREILERYRSEEAHFEHRALLLTVNASSEEDSLYEATRYAWKISLTRAARAEVVLAVKRGVIVAAYTVDRWLEATSENFPNHDPAPGRFGFVGRPAPASMERRYVRKRLPVQYRKRGSSNPVKYTYR